LSKPANYIAETDTSSQVHFSYLSPGIYKAFWVDDRNRDDIWEPENERAQPFKKEFITLKKGAEDSLSTDSLKADSLGANSLGTLYIANSDTAAPELQGIGLFSSQRLRLRFSENILLTDSTHFTLQDSVSQQKHGHVFALYIMPKEEYVLFAHSSKPLHPDSTFKLTIQNIADEAGNVQPTSVMYFTGSGQKDTTDQRIIGASVGKGIFANDPVKAAYAEPITRAAIRDSIKVIVGDSVHSSWKRLKIERNKLSIFPDSIWREGKDYEFRLWNPIAKDRRKIKPTIWYQSDLGSLHINFEDSTSKAAKRKTQLSIKTAEGKQIADTSFTGEIKIPHLAPVKYQVIMYQDLNGNGMWDYGTVSPFKPPEPYYIHNDVPVKSGLTSDLTVSFQERNAEK
jgi:hypothetical protein